MHILQLLSEKMTTLLTLQYRVADNNNNVINCFRNRYVYSVYTLRVLQFQFHYYTLINVGTDA